MFFKKSVVKYFANFVGKQTPVLEFVFNIVAGLKPRLHCTIFSTFIPHFMYWKYLMDKYLLHISLTKFNKLNFKKLKNKQNIKAWFLIYFCKAFALYPAFIFSTFCLSLSDRLIYNCSRTIFFWLEVKIMCCELYGHVRKVRPENRDPIGESVDPRAGTQLIGVTRDPKVGS